MERTTERLVLQEKHENAIQPSSTVTVNNTNNIKAVGDPAIVNKETQLQSNKNILKESEENIDPFTLRRFGDVSNLFSTPDSLSPNGTFTETTLPDIINTLPTITVDSPGNDVLNISSLASHFNALHVHTVDDPNILNDTITKPNVSPSNISSDDELFAECESFPASANNSKIDFNVTNTIELEKSTKYDENLKVNNQVAENRKIDSNNLSELNLVQNVSQNDIVIQLSQNVNQKINGEKEIITQDLTSPQLDIAAIKENDFDENLSANAETAIKGNDELEKGDVHKVLEEKTPEDSLEYIPTDENIAQKQRENIFTEEDNLTDSLNEIIVNTNMKSSESTISNKHLNISAQWTDIVSSVNCNEQENLENSQIDLLNTTPQEIVDEVSTTPIVEEKSLKQDNSDLKENESALNKNQNDVEIFKHNENKNLSFVNQNNIEIQGNAKNFATPNSEIFTHSPNEQFKLNEIDVQLSKQNDISEKANTMSTSADLKLPIDPPNIVGSENTTFESNLSNSRNSLNDVGIININQSVSENIQPSYSNDVTMEVCDETINKTLDITTENNSKLAFDKTQDISPMDKTQNLSSSPKITNTIALNVTKNELNNDIDVNKLENLSLQSILENNSKNDKFESQDQKFVCISNSNLQSNDSNDSKFDNVQINNLNLTQLNKPENEIINSENFANMNQIENVPDCRNDVESMDVDISFENENEQKFMQLHGNIGETEILPFSTLPSNYDTCKNTDEFKSIGNDNNVDLIFQSCDFEYLSKRGNNTVRDIRKDSLLLKFDPLLGKPIPVTSNLSNRSAIHEEEDAITPDTSISNSITNKEKEFQIDNNNILINVPTRNIETQIKKQKSPIKLSINKKDIKKSLPVSAYTVDSPLLEEFEKLERKLELEERQGAVINKMSVDVISNNIKIENDVQTNENINSNINSIEKQDLKMEDLEKKIKNEVLKTEDVEKKLKDAEQREEALLKRITDKDKTIAKMGGVIEAYEKAIAELIAEKEQITQNYEKQMEEIKAERDLNKQHLESLESTFTDLHVKYERSKQLLAKLKASEEELQGEKKRNLENLGLQEQRYEKMKNHAMQQLEIANNKLEHLTKNHQLEITKLKALLKKEEIAKSSVNEQLIQKSKENEELVKICEELINGGSTS